MLRITHVLVPLFLLALCSCSSDDKKADATVDQEIDQMVTDTALDTPTPDAGDVTPDVPGDVTPDVADSGDDTADSEDMGPPDPVPGVELWCVANSGNCLCSEPMEDAGSGVGLPDGHNFADSPAATECDRHGAFFGVVGNPDPSGITTVDEGGMPAGNTVARVIEQPGTLSNAIWLYSHLGPQAGEQRRVYRYHFQVSTDWSGSTGHGTDPCPSGRNKLMQLTTRPMIANQIQKRNNGGTCTGPPADYANLVLTVLVPGLDDNYGFEDTMGNEVDFSDCWVGVGWCAVEMAISGDLEAGTSMYLQGRITTLSNNTVYTTQKVGPIGGGPPFDGTLNGGDIFHGPSSNPNTGNGTGTMWLSHWLEASWTTDEDQWPGASCEVTGTCP